MISGFEYHWPQIRIPCNTMSLSLLFRCWQVIFIHPFGIAVCVLNGLLTRKNDQIMRWCISKTHSGIATVLDSVAFCYVLLPRPPWYSILHLRYHTSSFAHPRITYLCSIISTYRTCTSAHLGIYRIYPRIPIYFSTLP